MCLAMHASYTNDAIFSSKIYYYITWCTKLSNHFLIMVVEYIKYTIRIVKLMIDYEFSIPMYNNSYLLDIFCKWHIYIYIVKFIF